MKRIIGFILITTLVIPHALFASHNNNNDCWEDNDMCEDIRDLGDDELDEFPNPIFLDVTADELEDTWGDARSNGRTHEGTDIFADRGAYVVMPVDGVVDRLDTSNLGGKHAFVYVGGGQKLYFAHLDDWAPGLDDGDKVEKGSLIGYVGNTGAPHAVPHLHLTIYEDNEAENPFPLMEDTDWSLKDKIKAIDTMLDNLPTRYAKEEAKNIVVKYAALIKEAQDKKIRLPEDIDDALDEVEDQDDEEVEEGDLEAAADFDSFDSDLSYGDEGDDVEALQEFLNKVEGEKLDINGEFDSDTLAAVKRFQTKYKAQVLDIWGLTEGTGFVGPTTRMRMNFMILADDASCPLFTEYNSRTLNTTTDEVQKTEELLKELGLFSGTPDKTWNSETHTAMVEFQEKFSATMLKPWGLTKGTGYKYKTTNKFMNYLRGCDTGSIDLDGKGEFDF